MQSKAKTVAAYLAELPEDRRTALEAIRKVIVANLDADIEEVMNYGMIGYVVPHRVFPDGYHCDPKLPLPYGGLASQKNYMSLYLMSVYCGAGGDMPTNGNPHAEWFKEAWAKTGKKLDMGAACIRFKKLEDVPLEVIGEAIRRVTSKVYIKFYLKGLEMAAEAKQARKAAGTKVSAKAAKPKATKAAVAKKVAAPVKAKKAVATVNAGAKKAAPPKKTIVPQKATKPKMKK